MRAVNPYVDVPGDSDSRIMSRSGDCVGMSYTHAVWRFGFVHGSPAHKAYGVSLPEKTLFTWVLATRKTGKVKEVLHDKAAVELPMHFRKVMNWEP